MATHPLWTDRRNAGGDSSGVSASRDLAASTTGGLRDRIRRGTWRVAVAEESMAPALSAGDWLLIDPIPSRWPRRGSIVVFHEPYSGILAIKRVAAGPGDRVCIAAGLLHLAPDEAWLLGDNAAISLDSRRYGPVTLDALVGRAWFRYGPLGRVGPLRRSG